MQTRPYVNPLAKREPELPRGGDGPTAYEPWTPEEIEAAKERELARLARFQARRRRVS